MTIALCKLQATRSVKKGYFVYAINDECVIFLKPKDVKSKLKSATRPMKVRFCKPCSKSDQKDIKTPDNEKRVQKWEDSDVIRIVPCSCRITFPCVATILPT